jgi:hypothetical protein
MRPSSSCEGVPFSFIALTRPDGGPPGAPPPLGLVANIRFNSRGVTCVKLPDGLGDRGDSASGMCDPGFTFDQFGIGKPLKALTLLKKFMQTTFVEIAPDESKPTCDLARPE